LILTKNEISILNHALPLTLLDNLLTRKKFLRKNLAFTLAFPLSPFQGGGLATPLHDNAKKFKIFGDSS